MKNAIYLLTTLVLIVIVVVGLNFYWHEWRPDSIRKMCYQKVTNDIEKIFESHSGNLSAFVAKQKMLKEDFDRLYKNCLLENGLEN